MTTEELNELIELNERHHSYESVCSVLSLAYFHGKTAKIEVDAWRAAIIPDLPFVRDFFEQKYLSAKEDFDKKLNGRDFHLAMILQSDIRELENVLELHQKSPANSLLISTEFYPNAEIKVGLSNTSDIIKQIKHLIEQNKNKLAEI